MKKRLLVLITALLVLLAACGSTNETKSQESETTLTQNTSDNPLISADFKTADVKSGSGDILGQRGYINLSKSDLKTITNEQLVDFANEKVAGSGLNWVAIICEDGTGICFSGSIKEIASYGKLDSEGALLSAEGDLMLKNGIYEYTK